MQEGGEYRLEFLPLFYQELNDAAMYIALELNNPDAADQLVESVFEAVYKRQPFAESFEPVHSKFHRELKYYRIYIKNFIVYYVVIPSECYKTMEIRRFVYKKRDLADL